MSVTHLCFFGMLSFVIFSMVTILEREGDKFWNLIKLFIQRLSELLQQLLRQWQLQHEPKIEFKKLSHYRIGIYIYVYLLLCRWMLMLIQTVTERELHEPHLHQDSQLAVLLRQEPELKSLR